MFVTPPTVVVASTGFPTAANTGYVLGTVFTDNGPTQDIIVTTPNQTFTSVRTHSGAVSVRAGGTNCVFQNCYFKLDPGVGLAAGNFICECQVGGSVTFRDCEFDGDGSPATDPVGDTRAGHACVGGSGAVTLLRCNIHGMGMGYQTFGGGTCTIQDSFIHDLYIRNDLGTHNQCIQITPASPGPIRVLHNALECWDQTACFIISTVNGSSGVHDVLVDNNLLNGGTEALYCGKPSGGDNSVVDNCRYTNNHFGKKFSPTCGLTGPATAYDPAAAGNQWSGNIWDDGSGTLPPPV